MLSLFALLIPVVLLGLMDSHTDQSTDEEATDTDTAEYDAIEDVKITYNDRDDDGYGVNNNDQGPQAYVGTQDHDIINGGDSSDTIQGGDGNDYIDGHFGADQMIGGDGNDTIIGYQNIYDTYIDTDSIDQIDAGAGDDEIHLGAGDIVSSGSGNDIIQLWSVGSNILDYDVDRDTLEIIVFDQDFDVDNADSGEYIFVSAYEIDGAPLTDIICSESNEVLVTIHGVAVTNIDELNIAFKMA